MQFGLCCKIHTTIRLIISTDYESCYASATCTISLLIIAVRGLFLASHLPLECMMSCAVPFSTYGKEDQFLMHLWTVCHLRYCHQTVVSVTITNCILLNTGTAEFWGWTMHSLWRSKVVTRASVINLFGPMRTIGQSLLPSDLSIGKIYC